MFRSAILPGLMPNPTAKKLAPLARCRCREVIHVINGYMQKIQILFPDPVMARLRKLARVQDRPVSEIVRRAVDEALAKSPEASERPKRIPSFRGGKMLCSAADLREALYSGRLNKQGS
jgi:hypothetical protein